MTIEAKKGQINVKKNKVSLKSYFEIQYLKASQCITFRIIERWFQQKPSSHMSKM